MSESKHIEYKYNKKFFNPTKKLQTFDKECKKEIVGDDRNGRIYYYTEEIILAINVAMATGRPLLLAGNSGCGKSSLAYNIARYLKRRYYEYVITSRSQARDLLWTFDAVRRLADNNKENGSLFYKYCPYIEPGVLWWIFDQSSAQRRGLPLADNYPSEFLTAKDPSIYEPENQNANTGSKSSVLLLDEIDKADPDFVNNLLVPLGSYQFIVNEIATPIKLETNSQEVEHPLIIITTNKEKKLSKTFLRRCVILEIKQTRTELIEIAKAHYGPDEKKILLYEKTFEVMDKINNKKQKNSEDFLDDFNIDNDQSLKNSQSKQDNSDEPFTNLSTAEYLDTIKAILSLTSENVDFNNPDTLQILNQISERITWKGEV